MRTARIALALIGLCGLAFGQEAKIMIVEHSDSQKLAKSYQDYKDALKHWEEAKAQVAKQYTQQNGKTIEGWEKIQFSVDFRAIVPESSTYASRSYCGWTGNVVNTSSAVPVTGNTLVFTGTGSGLDISGSGTISTGDGSSSLTIDNGIVDNLIVKEKKPQN